jgi:two-component system, cell cycle sensor histidine kinase and response regulator CckA
MPHFIRSLSFRLILLVLFAAVPAFGLMFYNAIERYQHERVEAQENALRIVRQIAMEHDRIIALTRQLLMTLAHYPPVLNRDSVQCSAICADLLKGQTTYLNLGAYDPEGNTYCSGLPLSAPVSGADLPYFQRIIETGEFSGSDFRIGRITGKPTVHFGYPAIDQAGKLQAVTFVALDLSWLKVLATKIDLPEGSTLTAVDQNGTILVRHPEPEKWVGQKLTNTVVLATASAQEEGLAQGVGMDGAERVYAVRRLSGAQTAGFVYIGLPAEHIFGEAKRMLSCNMIGLGLATMVAMLGAWGLSYLFIMGPVKVLTDASTKLAAGDLSARTGLTQKKGEIGELGMSFDRMGEALQLRSALYTQALTELERLQRRQELILNSAWEGIFGLDLNGNHTFVNPSAAGMLGYEVEELLGQHSHTTWHHSKPDGSPYPEEDCPIYATLRDGEVHHMREEVFWRKDGNSFLAECMSAPIVDEGEIIGAVVSFLDVTEPRKARQALRESEERYRQAYQKTPVMMQSINRDGQLVAVSDYWLETMRYERNEVLGRNPADFQTQESRRYALEVAIPNFLKTGVSRDEPLQFVKKTGEVVDVLLTATAERNDKGEIVRSRAVLIDITERKRTETELRESEQRYRLLFNNMLEGCAYCKMLFEDGRAQDFIYLDVNDAFERLTGLKNVIGEKVTEVIPGIRESNPELFEIYGRVVRTGNPEKLEAWIESLGIWFSVSLYRTETDHFVAVFDNITERKRAQEEILQAKRDWEDAFDSITDMITIHDKDFNIVRHNKAAAQALRLPDCLSSDRVKCFEYYHGTGAPPEGCPSCRCLLTGKQAVFETFEPHLNIFMELRAIPRLDATNRLTGLIHIVRDITERKRGEEEKARLEQQLLQAQKMEAVGTLAGGVAHDFNNILQVVLGYSDLILSDEHFPEQFKNDLEKVNQAARNGADLVSRLLMFSRKSEINPLPINLNRRIEQLQKMLSRTLPKMIEIELVLPDDLSSVHADPTQVDQILMNLAVNARDAMPEGGTLTIQTENVTLDEEYAKTHLDAKPGHYVLLSVSDTGQGMDKETLQHIFEPFFTTKGPGEGTGLGLAMVYGIVKQHGAHIMCYSEPGKGTAFRMYFPALVSDEESLEIETKQLPRGGAETILLADDEDLICDLGARILTKAGYTVITASNGEEALEVYQARSDEISLVILDLIMPTMGGKQCLEELLKIEPQIKVLIASGYSADGRTKEIVEAGAKGFVSKPYNVQSMLQAARDALDSNQDA